MKMREQLFDNANRAGTEPRQEVPTMGKRLLKFHIEDDRPAACYRATCENGYRWEEQLHEYVSGYDDRTKREALSALRNRIAEGPPEVCDDPDCEWCHGADGKPRAYWTTWTKDDRVWYDQA